MSATGTRLRRTTASLVIFATGITGIGLLAAPASAAPAPISSYELTSTLPSSVTVAGAPAATAPSGAAAPIPGGDLGEPQQGPKSWVVKQALKGVAATVRGGGGKFISIAEKEKWIDAAAANAVRNNSSRIADVIEDVANIPDLATHRVRTEVYKGLVKFLPSGTANVIANCVEGIMWILL